MHGSNTEFTYGGCRTIPSPHVQGWVYGCVDCKCHIDRGLWGTLQVRSKSTCTGLRHVHGVQVLDGERMQCTVQRYCCGWVQNPTTLCSRLQVASMVGGKNQLNKYYRVHTDTPKQKNQIQSNHVKEARDESYAHSRSVQTPQLRRKILFRSLALLLGSLFSIRHLLILIVAAVRSIVHFRITAVTAALVFRVKFFGNVRVRLGLEVLVNRLFVFIS